MRCDRYWFLTWTTYGTWLPGDRRGFVSDVKAADGSAIRHNIPGTEYDANLPALETYAALQQKTNAVKLSKIQAELLLNQFPETVEFRQWTLFATAIMPKHIHLFLSALQGTLKESIEDFKRWTGHQASSLVNLPNGRFWQDEWFDHWSRSDEQDERIMRYIQNNPVTAGLVKVFREWKYGGWS